MYVVQATRKASALAFFPNLNHTVKHEALRSCLGQIQRLVLGGASHQGRLNIDGSLRTADASSCDWRDRRTRYPAAHKTKASASPQAIAIFTEDGLARL
jgi:hypothetical protein